MDSFCVLFMGNTALYIQIKENYWTGNFQAVAEIIFGFISCGFRGQRQNYSLIHLIFTECLAPCQGSYLVS